jgi:flagellar protein FliO/FliZ
MDTVPSASAAPAQDAPRSPAAPQTTTQAPGQVVADSPAPPSADVPAATASGGAQGAAATAETPAPAAPHTIAGIPSRPARTTALAMQPGHAAPPSAAGTLGGTLFALALVLGLIFGLAWLARRMPGLAGTRGNGLRIVASTALGARERLLVVEVGGQQLLLATGTAGTRLLHTLETPLPVEAPAQPVPFAQLLAQQFGKKA